MSRQRSKFSLLGQPSFSNPLDGCCIFKITFSILQIFCEINAIAYACLVVANACHAGYWHFSQHIQSYKRNNLENGVKFC